jgi:hypothetical protein
MAASEQHYTLPLPAFDKPVKLLIVVAPYYKDIADNAGRRRRGRGRKGLGAEVDLVEVPGALEVPTAIGMAGRMARYDGYVGLGCVIRGETTHYDTVCNDSSRGLTLLGLQGLHRQRHPDGGKPRAGRGAGRSGGAGQGRRRGRGGLAPDCAVAQMGGMRRASDFAHDLRQAPTKRQKRQMKSAARLYAVQALFQMESSGQTVEKRPSAASSRPTASAPPMRASLPRRCRPFPRRGGTCRQLAGARSTR